MNSRHKSKMFDLGCYKICIKHRGPLCLVKNVLRVLMLCFKTLSIRRGDGAPLPGEKE